MDNEKCECPLHNNYKVLSFETKTTLPIEAKAQCQRCSKEKTIFLHINEVPYCTCGVYYYSYSLDPGEMQKKHCLNCNKPYKKWYRDDILSCSYNSLYSLSHSV